MNPMHNKLISSANEFFRKKFPTSSTEYFLVSNAYINMYLK